MGIYNIKKIIHKNKQLICKIPLQFLFSSSLSLSFFQSELQLGGVHGVSLSLLASHGPVVLKLQIKMREKFTTVTLLSSWISVSSNFFFLCFFFFVCCGGKEAFLGFLWAIVLCEKECRRTDRNLRSTMRRRSRSGGTRTKFSVSPRTPRIRKSKALIEEWLSSMLQFLRFQLLF